MLTSVLAHVEVPFENGKVVGMWNMVYMVGQSRISTVDFFSATRKKNNFHKYVAVPDRNQDYSTLQLLKKSRLKVGQFSHLSMNLSWVIHLP